MPEISRPGFREFLPSAIADREAGGRVDVGFIDGAIPLLRTLLQLEPDHVESLYNLGMVYSDRMQLKEAPAAPLPGRQHRFSPAGGRHPLCGRPAAAAWKRMRGLT